MSAPHELSVTRLIAAPRDHVWRVFTERMAEWWCPKPWTTEIVEQARRAGGRSAMVMRGPDGEEHAMEGVVLDWVDRERLVFTDAYAAGWVPQEAFMTGIFELADEHGGTRYTATARHWTAEAKARHEAMGFHPGWDIVADQFKALCEG